jgi:hydrogenase-4 component B
MSVLLVLLGTALTAISGVPGLFARRTSMIGQWLSIALGSGGALAGLAGIAAYWTSGENRSLSFPWLVSGAEFSVGIDGLSAIFLAPVFLISLLGHWFGLSYWRQTEHCDNGRKLRCFYGTITAGMALLVIASNGVLFLIGWEIMALSAFFLVTTEDGEQKVREAGWIYLVAAHVATLCLFGLFALLRAATGSFALTRLPPDSLSPGMSSAIVVLALVGFGVKAGLMPLHVWLPSSHAIAPSHVSAIMSGVILKMGIYGLVRVTSLMPNLPFAWGAITLGLGVVSGVLGVAYAIGQHDLKRLLAYHSIENIGIIVMGLGLALIGRSLGRAEWVVLGLGGALLHVWNHALFKSLLFFSAGSVIHSVHTREIDHLGGLAKAMPWTAACFLVGAVAICGLPPLNGFVSEFLIYLGLFATLRHEPGGANSWASFAAPALALIGALAAACFVKVFGAVFLGTARSEHAGHAHESPPGMIAPMGVLVACCGAIGLAPAIVAPVLEAGLSAWMPNRFDGGPRIASLAPLNGITTTGLLLVAALAVGSGLLWLRRRNRSSAVAATWGCGYVAPTPRMQYTSSSFAQLLVGLFGWALRPRVRKPSNLPLFPRSSDFCSDVPDAVLDRGVLPAIAGAAWMLSWLRVLQRGNIQIYLLYIFLILIALLLWR